nr:MAG TPA: hypothetical protein [Caudoviricetes sp.]
MRSGRKRRKKKPPQSVRKSVRRKSNRCLTSGNLSARK